jgi:excinuclease UvrABC nuclease subunit
LGISSKTLYNLKFLDVSPLTPCVYKITYQDEIIYIGSTSNFENRKYQHLSAIEEKSAKSKLYRYCLDNNIKANQLKIEPLISEDEFSRFNIEQTIIKLLKPVGNCE